MGLDFYGYFIYGVGLPTLYHTTNTPGCSHVVDVSFAYCPVCGKQRVTTQRDVVFQGTNIAAKPVRIDPQAIYRYNGIAEYDEEVSRVIIGIVVKPLNPQEDGMFVFERVPREWDVPQLARQYDSFITYLDPSVRALLPEPSLHLYITTSY